MSTAKVIHIKEAAYLRLSPGLRDALRGYEEAAYVCVDEVTAALRAYEEATALSRRKLAEAGERLRARIVALAGES